MMCTTALFGLAVIVAFAECASVGGRISLDRNAASAGYTVEFPRIPFINAPPSSIFFPRWQPPAAGQQPGQPPAGPQSGQPPAGQQPGQPPVEQQPGWPSVGQQPGQPPAGQQPGQPPAGRSPNIINSVRDLFDIPNVRSLIPRLPSSGRSSSISVPRIGGASDGSPLSRMPGVNLAIQSARNHIRTALNITSDFTAGIEQAIAAASNSSDPTAAITRLAETVLNAYITAAENCPLIVIGSRVLQEGIRLAGEIAQAAANVIFGTTTTAVTTESTTTVSTSTSTDSTSTSTDSTSASTDSSSTTVAGSSTT